MGLREDNILKNLAFDKTAWLIVLSSFLIFLGTAWTAIETMNEARATMSAEDVDAFQESVLLNSLLAMCSISFIIFFGMLCSMLGGKCPECKARWYAKLLSKELAEETCLTTYDKNSGMDVSTISRTYNENHICEYCGYKWSKPTTETETHRLQR